MTRPIEPEVHWSEGLFLQPHHLQAQSRHVASLLGNALLGARPYAWGFRSLEIADPALANFLFRIERCEAVFPDGRVVQVPETAEVEAREFKEFLAAGSELPVRLGLRLHRDAAPNLDAGDGRAEPGRFLLRDVERRDENTGENPQRIDTRRFRLRFFLGEEETSGYATIPIAHVRRSAGIGAAPERTPYVPPLLDLAADARLRECCKELCEQILTKDRILGDRLSRRRITFRTAAGAEAEEILKVHALNTEIPALREALIAPDLHPLAIYLVLLRICGALSIFDETRVPGDLPAYTHEDPWACFSGLVKRIRDLLDKVAPTWFTEVPFEVVKRDVSGSFQKVALREEWLAPEYELWLGVIGPGRKDVAEDLAANKAKLGSPT